MLIRIIFITLWVSILFAQEQFKTAESCGKCHPQIFQEWQQSMHANATAQKDPLFNGMYSWGVEDTQGKLKKKCIVCHSPMSTVFNSIDSNKAYNQEGITCQFCHGAKEIDAFHSAKDIQIDLTTIYSSQPKPDNPAHAVAHRDHFEQGEICLPCHAEMHNPKGVQVCATGNEWQSYHEQTGKNCQDCHMPDIEGHPSHLFPGTHKGGVLKNAVDMKLNWRENELSITLNNTGAGHALPTGTPLRMVILKVMGYNKSGKVIWENWKNNPIKEDKSALFMKILGDAKGNGPVPPWKATQIIYDRHLMPGEPISIGYQIEDKSLYDIEVRLLYRFAPPPILRKLNITDPHFTQPKLIVEKGMKVGG